MADDEEDRIPFFSQFPSHQHATQGSSAGGNLGRGMGFLDLNSNVDVFPELGSYQQLLFDQSAGHGRPPVGPGRGRPVPQGGGGRSRSLNIGGRAGSHLRLFVAPGAAAVEGGVIGRGRTVSQELRDGGQDVAIGDAEAEGIGLDPGPAGQLHQGPQAEEGGAPDAPISASARSRLLWHVSTTGLRSSPANATTTTTASGSMLSCSTKRSPGTTSASYKDGDAEAVVGELRVELVAEEVVHGGGAGVVGCHCSNFVNCRCHILHYFVLKWALCFLDDALTAAAAFVANLGVENVVGAKFVVTSNRMFARR
ncbi:hypothetical protein ZWY2020_026319 [Hordeum vulgare]|nr:hypothetical protein ZWY2020_026319 [Hordeum vulgare]